MKFEDLVELLEEKLAELTGDFGLYIKFLNRNEVYEKNPIVQFWAASTIKAPIASYFFHYCQENPDFMPTEKVSIKHENMVKGSGIAHLLSADASFSYLDLVKLMIILSDNAATNEIVDLLDWQNINAYLSDLGMAKTQFRHKMMITAGRGPNLTTAADMALFFEKLFHKELPKSQQQLDILNEVKLRDRIPALLPNELKIAHKPGSLPQAVHDTGIVYAKSPFIFSFLSDDQADKKVTYRVVQECALACYNYAQAI